MIDEQAQITQLGDDDPRHLRVGGDFSMPLATTTRGRLIFASGAVSVRIEANLSPSDLYAAHFSEHIPSVRVQDGIVMIHYRRHLFFEDHSEPRQPLALVKLNTTIPWEIEFRNGVSRLEANLRAIQMHALDMGSVSQATFKLPVPLDRANIYLSDSASNLTLHRPPGVALRLQIAGAASHLMLDNQPVGASGGLRWQSSDYNQPMPCYDVDVAGSVSNLTIDCSHGLQG